MAVARLRVPELHPPILGPAENPLVIRSQCNAENKVLELYIRILPQ